MLYEAPDGAVDSKNLKSRRVSIKEKLPMNNIPYYCKEFSFIEMLQELLVDFNLSLASHIRKPGSQE